MLAYQIEDCLSGNKSNHVLEPALYLGGIFLIILGLNELNDLTDQVGANQV